MFKFTVSVLWMFFAVSCLWAADKPIRPVQIVVPASQHISPKEGTCEVWSMDTVDFNKELQPENTDIMRYVTFFALNSKNNYKKGEKGKGDEIFITYGKSTQGEIQSVVFRTNLGRQDNGSPGIATLHNGKIKIKADSWHFYAVTWRVANGKVFVKMYVDGKKCHEKELKYKKNMLPSSLRNYVIMIGGFPKSLSTLESLRISSKEHSEQEIKKAAASALKPAKDTLLFLDGAAMKSLKKHQGAFYHGDNVAKDGELYGEIKLLNGKHGKALRLFSEK